MGIAGILKKLLLGRAFAAENGRITILGSYNVSLLESHGFAVFLQKLYEELKEKKFYKILKEVTTISIKEIYQSLGVTPSVNELEKSLPFMDIYGWGKIALVNKGENKNSMFWLVKVTNSPITEYAKKMFGKKSEVCILYRSNFEAAFELALKKPIKVEEIACFCKGAPACTFRIEVEK